MQKKSRCSKFLRFSAAPGDALQLDPAYVERHCQATCVPNTSPIGSANLDITRHEKYRLFTFTFRTIVLQNGKYGNRSKNRKIFFLHFSTFHDLLIPKNPKKRNFFGTFLYVCMSRPKSLNISRSPNARALILVSKHFSIWGIDAIKNCFRIGRGFWSYPHFSLF